MEKIKIIIIGNVISKKNSQRIFYKWSRNVGRKVPFITPSMAYKNWEDGAIKQLMCQPVWLGDYPVKMKCVFYRASKQKFDFSNMIESVQDALVRAGTIHDDSYRHLIPVTPSMDVDLKNPRVEIELTRIEK